MTQPPTSPTRRRPAGRFEIRLAGHLDARWSAWFDGMSLRRDSDGTTLITGPVIDQAALHGLLQKVRDTGLPLLSVTPTGPALPGTTESPTTH